MFDNLRDGLDRNVKIENVEYSKKVVYDGKCENLQAQFSSHII
jgi:hypothetical protein